MFVFVYCFCCLCLYMLGVNFCVFEKVKLLVVDMLIFDFEDVVVFDVKIDVCEIVCDVVR